VTVTRRKQYADLRSARWYGATDMRSFGHRSRTKQMGFSAEDYGGKPVIGKDVKWGTFTLTVLDVGQSDFTYDAATRTLTATVPIKHHPKDYTKQIHINWA